MHKNNSKNASKNIKISVLVSVGEHPLSARPCRAEQDARALELGLMLAPENLQIVYAGTTSDSAAAAVLKEYMGMGIDQVEVLDVPPKTDVTLPLLEKLKQDCPDVVLTGMRAENGESSGMLPYLLSEQLKMAMVPAISNILSIDKTAGFAEVLQALPRGQRRKVKVNLPFIASVDMAAAAPRQSAYGSAMRGHLKIDPVTQTMHDADQEQWQISPAQARPKRLKIVKAKTAADRFKAATAKVQGGLGKVIYDNKESAEAILKLLKDEKIL
ncbi:MAG: electron transfer flavoprotein subunit beta [Paraglaciecola sp.]|uniref:electron transfer flavoprotein subunit beta n=1 Tax=Paraglaciecola sp. TaxID=1920173 RepID=UPI0032992053